MPTPNLTEVKSRPKRLTRGQRQRVLINTFRPFANEVGWIAYEWNTLHEKLADLFADISTADRKMSYAIWYSVPSDRLQRGLLQVALEAITVGEDDLFRLRDDTLWILDQFSCLADKRNGAIHVPLAFLQHSGAPETDIEVITYHYNGNPHANKLKGKPLLGEFRWYSDHLARLAAFADGLHSAWTFSAENYPWPHRPQLPSRGHYPNHTAQRRKNAPK